MKTSPRSLAFIALLVIGLALFPDVQAVVPPPDGGYTGGKHGRRGGRPLQPDYWGMEYRVGYAGAL